MEIVIDWELGLVELDNTRKLKLPESILEAKASDPELFNVVIDFWNHPSNNQPQIKAAPNFEVYTTDNGKFTFGVVHMSSLIYLLLTGKVATKEQLPIIEDVLQSVREEIEDRIAEYGLS